MDAFFSNVKLFFAGETRGAPTPLGYPFGPADGAPPTGVPVSNADDRIARILNDANKAMKADDAGGAAAAAAGRQLASPFGASGAETAQERMSKLYQEELTRLMSKNAAGSTPPSSKAAAAADLTPGIFSGLGAPGFFPRGAAAGLPPADLQRAMDIYQQEFSRLQQNALAQALKAQNGDNDKANDKKGDIEDGVKLPSSSPSKSPSRADAASPSMANKLAAASQAAAAVELLSGAAAAGHNKTDMPTSLSPLQRMASITNSLVSHPHLPQPNSHSQRPMRAVLPPITQQQFDKFQHLNTDETVRRVSENKLSLKVNFSISPERKDSSNSVAYTPLT